MTLSEEREKPVKSGVSMSSREATLVQLSALRICNWSRTTLSSDKQRRDCKGG